MGKYRWLGVCAGAALAAHAQDACAQGRDTTCLGEIGAVRIEGDLQVVGRCTLAGTEVRGNVTLSSGGSLTARDARIRGSLEGSRADFVDLERSRVDGRVRLDSFVGDASAIELTEVQGNVELTSNRSKFEILNNDLGGDLQASFNTGGLLISGNLIDDDLRCILNLPAPVGIGNRVDGDTEGQCESLPPGESPPAPPPSPTPTPTPSPTPTPTPSPTPPPTSSPPPATPPPTTELIDEGGAGAIGWPVALLLPLVAWRRWRRRHHSPS